MRRIIAQMRKELTQIVRDWRTLALALALPVVLLLLLSTALSLTVNELPIVVQDFDGSTASHNFIDAFRASITLHVVRMAGGSERRGGPCLNMRTSRADHPVSLWTRHGARRERACPVHGGRRRMQIRPSWSRHMPDRSPAAYNQQTTGDAKQDPMHSRHSACGSTRDSPQKSFTARDIRAWPLHVPASAGCARHGERG